MGNQEAGYVVYSQRAKKTQSFMSRWSRALVMGSHQLGALDVSRYEVFAVVSDQFWRTRKELVRDFFEHLRPLGSTGFLAAATQRVCREVTAELRVDCVVSSQQYRYDGALSKERWRIILHFLHRHRRIVYAGLDVRFLRPVQSFLVAAKESLSSSSSSSSRDGSLGSRVDAAFEGTYDERRSTLHDFTPDLAAAFPTPQAVDFFNSLLESLRARSVTGLPAYMRESAPTLLRFNLMGPAEQDLLKDSILSALYNRTVALRKYAIAKGAAKIAGLDFRDAPKCSRAAERAEGHTERWKRACNGTGVLRLNDLTPLHATRTRHGTVLATPKLSIFLTDQRILRTGGRFCLADDNCAWARTNNTLALHCLEKRAECLDIARCRCLHMTKI
jgi:hypothetical protein